MSKTRAIIRTSVALCAAILALASWAISSPVGSTPDEDYHLASIWCSHGYKADTCEPGESTTTLKVPEILVKSSSCYAFQPSKSAKCDLSQFDMVDTDRVNELQGYYPKLYYWLMGLFVGPDVNASLMIMRTVNILICALGLLFASIIAYSRIKLLPIWGFVLTTVPSGMFLVASINPSGASYVSVIIVFTTLSSFFAAERAWQSWLLALATITFSTLGAGSRSDTSIYLALSVVIAWIVFERQHVHKKASLFLSAGVLGIAYLFFLTSSQVSIRFQGESAPILSNLFYNFENLPGLLFGSLGSWSLGWLDTPLSPVVFIFAFTCYISVVVESLNKVNIRKFVAQSIIGVALIGLPMYVLTRGGFIVGQEVQARYLMPLLALLLLSSIYKMPYGTLANSSRIRLVFVAVALAIANSSALHTNIRRYITGMDVGGLNLNYKVEWWSGFFDPNTVWVVGSLAFFAFVWTVQSITPVRGQSRPSEEESSVSSKGLKNNIF